MINTIPSTPIQKLPNYLLELYNKEDSFKSSMALHRIEKQLTKVINKIKSRENIKKLAFAFSSRSINYWINGKRPITIKNLFILLNKLKELDNKDKYHHEVLDEIYKNVKFYSFNHIKPKKIPKLITPQCSYLFGYHLGDVYLTNHYSISYSDASSEQLQFIKLLFKENYETEGKIIKDNRFEMFYLILYSKFLSMFLDKVIEIPVGRKNEIIIPSIIEISPLKIKKYFSGGFIDADGGIGSHSLTVTQTSNLILIFIRKVLKKFKINSNIRGPYGPYKNGINPEWKLQIDKRGDLKKLKDENICFHPHINKRLEEIL